MKKFFLFITVLLFLFLTENISAIENFNDKNHLLYNPSLDKKLTKKFHPSELVEMKNYGIYTLRPGRNEGKVRKIIINDLKNFQDFCFEKTGKKIPVRSGYRSYTDQYITYKKYGKKFSAIPGTSEHQLGLAVDFGFKHNFLNHKNFPELTKCFHENSEKYGFILSYGIGNPNYDYEPWHFRYVGKKYAKIIKDNGLKHTPRIFLNDPKIYLTNIYQTKLNNRVYLINKTKKSEKTNKPHWEEISKIFSLEEGISAKIFLKRQINKSIKNGENKNFRKYTCAYNYLNNKK